eukprot:jgi/Undpi1/10030/HiC_scaffold_28.g12484.m1
MLTQYTNAVSLLYPRGQVEINVGDFNVDITDYRLKYAQYVKKKNLVKVSAVAGTAIATGAFCVLYHMPERYSSVLVPVGEYHGVCGAKKMCVVPIESSTTRSVDDHEGVLDYAEEGGEVAEVFGDFCRQSLCMESWDFIMDVVAYKKLTNPQEQFASFTYIMDQYLRSTSPQGINLGCEMQSNLLRFETRNLDHKREIVSASWQRSEVGTSIMVRWELVLELSGSLLGVGGRRRVLIVVGGVGNHEPSVFTGKGVYSGRDDGVVDIGGFDRAPALDNGLSPGGVGISSSGDEEGCQIDTISVPSEGRGVGGGLSPIVAGDGKETGRGCYGTDVS